MIRSLKLFALTAIIPIIIFFISFFLLIIFHFLKLTAATTIIGTILMLSLYISFLFAAIMLVTMTIDIIKTCNKKIFLKRILFRSLGVAVAFFIYNCVFYGTDNRQKPIQAVLFIPVFGLAASVKVYNLHPGNTTSGGKRVKNIIVLVSGGGTNLQAIIDACNCGKITNGKISCVISSNPNAYALTRAKDNNINTRILSRKEYTNTKEYGKAVTDALLEEKADLVVLAGFMSILDENVFDTFSHKIINVHPALIPSFCGEGYYGLHVHKAVLKSGVKITGATVHFVTEECDGGPIILQKAVEVKYGDTPEILQKRVMEQAEWDILPQAVSLFCNDRIFIEDNIAYIK